jgi:hypothetical protein
MDYSKKILNVMFDDVYLGPSDTAQRVLQKQILSVLDNLNVVEHKGDLSRMFAGVQPYMTYSLTQEQEKNFIEFIKSLDIDIYSVDFSVIKLSKEGKEALREHALEYINDADIIGVHNMQHKLHFLLRTYFDDGEIVDGLKNYSEVFDKSVQFLLTDKLDIRNEKLFETLMNFPEFAPRLIELGVSEIRTTYPIQDSEIKAEKMRKTVEMFCNIDFYNNDELLNDSSGSYTANYNVLYELIDFVDSQEEERDVVHVDYFVELAQAVLDTKVFPLSYIHINNVIPFKNIPDVVSEQLVYPRNMLDFVFKNAPALGWCLHTFQMLDSDLRQNIVDYVNFLSKKEITTHIENRIRNNFLLHQKLTPLVIQHSTTKAELDYIASKIKNNQNNIYINIRPEIPAFFGLDKTETEHIIDKLNYLNSFGKNYLLNFDNILQSNIDVFEIQKHQLLCGNKQNVTSDFNDEMNKRLKSGLLSKDEYEKCLAKLSDGTSRKKVMKLV